MSRFSARTNPSYHRLKHRVKADALITSSDNLKRVVVYVLRKRLKALKPSSSERL